MLGYILSSGADDLRDADAALEWYRKSAQQDCPQGRLGYGMALMMRADSPAKASAARDEDFFVFKQDAGAHGPADTAARWRPARAGARPLCRKARAAHWCRVPPSFTIGVPAPVLANGCLDVRFQTTISFRRPEAQLEMPIVDRPYFHQHGESRSLAAGLAKAGHT